MSVNKILVLGKTGEGKSTICNYILQYKEKKCKESNKPGSCTKTVEGFISNYYKDIFMIDTPGLSDSSGEDQMIVDRIRNTIKEKHCQGIKSIILVSNINTDRLSFDDKRLLLIYCKMFPIPEFWYHVGIVFSKSYEYFPEDALNGLKLAKQNDYLKDLIDTIEKHTNELNKNLPPEKQIQIPGIIQTFYTDCGDLVPGFNHDRTDKQIASLISWARGNTYLDFSGNDFNTEMDINYKHKEDTDDRIDKKVDQINENEKKITVKYYKAYKVIDFNDKENTIIAKEPYDIKITYIKTVEWVENKDGEKETIDGITKVKKEKITYTRDDIYDENRNLIEQGTPKEKNKTNKDIINEVRNTYTKSHHNYKNNPVYKSSKSEVHEYFEGLKEAPIGVKIVWAISNLHPVQAVINLALFIVSKIKKPERWRIIERYYRDEIWETVTHYKEDGQIDYKEPDRLIETKELPMEPDEPVRID